MDRSSESRSAGTNAAAANPTATISSGQRNRIDAAAKRSARARPVTPGASGGTVSAETGVGASASGASASGAAAMWAGRAGQGGAGTLKRFVRPATGSSRSARAPRRRMPPPPRPAADSPPAPRGAARSFARSPGWAVVGGVVLLAALLRTAAAWRWRGEVDLDVDLYRGLGGESAGRPRVRTAGDRSADRVSPAAGAARVCVAGERGVGDPALPDRSPGRRRRG